jgi:hypothetical protein
VIQHSNSGPQPPPHVTLNSLFDFQNPAWNDLFSSSVTQTYIEQANLHDLLDLEADGESDDEADVIPLDELTEEILFR